MPRKIAVRDGLIVVLTIFVWWLDAALRGGEPGWLAYATGLLAAVLAVLCGFLLHEWGHLAGARAGGSVVHISGRLSSVFLFNFDSDRNGPAQFLAMSLGGFAASAAALLFFIRLLPLDALSGQVALGLVLAGVVATLVLEIPTAWRVARGAPVPRGAAYRSSPDVTGTE